MFGDTCVGSRELKHDKGRRFSLGLSDITFIIRTTLLARLDRNSGRIFVPIVLFIWIVDQISKTLILGRMSEGGTIPIVKGVFYIALVHNTGAAFGILKKHPGVFLAIGICAAVTLVFLLVRKVAFLDIRERISLCFILGGTLGNLTDRIRLGFVVDFLDFRVWPVFNIADSFITVGALLLAWSVFCGIAFGEK